MIKKLLLILGAAVGGIYLTSEEGKKAREAIRRKKSTFSPIIKDLLKQANNVLDGSQKINSTEIKANIEKLISDAKKTLSEIDLEKTIEYIKDAIKVASKKISDAANESNSRKVKKVEIKK